MNRRAFVTGLGAVLAAPLSAEAQQAPKAVKIGWITVTPQDRNRGPDQFRQIVEYHLRQRGWEPDFELRYAAGDLDRLARMAEELVRARPDVIVAPDTNGAIAAKKAKSSVPIVMSSSDPIGAGLVASLARPGGNVTGVSAFFDEGVSNIAIVFSPANRASVERVKAVERAGTSLGLLIRRLEVRDAGEVDAVIQSLTRNIWGALIYDPDLTLLPYASKVIDAAQRQRIPTVVGFPPQATVLGALMA
jgi:putative ABC transport system substrate-binding protein